MKVQKMMRIASFLILLAIAIPASSATIVPEPTTAKTEDARGQQLLQRLNDIKAMDKSEMTRLEKKALRKEVIEIKKEMKKITGGIYLSAAAVIIIILLLLLLL